MLLQSNTGDEAPLVSEGAVLVCFYICFCCVRAYLIEVNPKQEHFYPSCQRVECADNGAA